MRLVVYFLVWLGCNLAIAGCATALGALMLFYTSVGPFACLYVAARLGHWCGLDVYGTGALMMAGLWLFGSIRVPLYRHVLRGWRHGFRLLRAAAALRDDLRRQYRLAARQRRSEGRP